MGPTWDKLVQVSVQKYPNATHGIIADADFLPMVDRIDKMELGAGALLFAPRLLKLIFLRV